MPGIWDLGWVVFIIGESLKTEGRDYRPARGQLHKMKALQVTSCRTPRKNPCEGVLLIAFGREPREAMAR